MERYIDADKFVKSLEKQSYYSKTNIETRISKMPTADVQPVIHAHWEIIYESSAGVTDARCSNCGYESLAYENDVHTDENCNYCPCCGAKMDER